MAVNSCKMRKDVICETGAVASADVYLWREAGRRRFIRSRREIGLSGGVEEEFMRRIGGLRKRKREGFKGRCIVRRRGLDNMFSLFSFGTLAQLNGFLPIRPAWHFSALYISSAEQQRRKAVQHTVRRVEVTSAVGDGD